MATAPQPVQLTDLISALKRHWSVVAAIAVIGLILGVLASFALPSTYRATTTVSVDAMTADPLSTNVDAARSVSIPTEIGLVTSSSVAAAAADTLEPRYSLDAEQVRNATSVDSPENSMILRIHFSGGSAKEAAAGADAVAEAYLTTRRTAASDEIARLAKSAQDQITALQARAARPESQAPIVARSLQIQSDALGNKLVQLSTIDLTPGQVVSSAEVPGNSAGPGALALGLAGLFLGLLVGIPVALLRKEEDSEIGGVDRMQAIGDQIVLDGTKDTNRADTWDIAAFMLKIPTEIGTDGPFMIMVDAEEGPNGLITPGQELVDALSRRGRSARFVDAGAINEGKISRGWPTEKKRLSWAGEIVVIDTTNLTSDANKVALATRSDSILLARTTADDAAALRRLAGLLKSKSVDIALTALFPARAEMVALHR